MARQRRKSADLETARERMTGLKSIQPVPDFGGDLNVAGGAAIIADCNDELDSYNRNVAMLDEQQIRVETKEEAASDWAKRLLAAGAARFGTDSPEYEALGGTRQSERKQRPRKGSGGRPPAKP
jgi:hypothetical protein